MAARGKTSQQMPEEKHLRYRGVNIYFWRATWPGYLWPESPKDSWDVVVRCSDAHPVYVAASTYGTTLGVNPKRTLSDAQALVNAAGVRP